LLIAATPLMPGGVERLRRHVGGSGVERANDHPGPIAHAFRFGFVYPVGCSLASVGVMAEMIQ